MNKQYYPTLEETVCREVLPNGLTVLVVPRPGFRKKLAYFMTDKDTFAPITVAPSFDIKTKFVISAIVCKSLTNFATANNNHVIRFVKTKYTLHLFTQEFYVIAVTLSAKATKV